MSTLVTEQAEITIGPEGVYVNTSAVQYAFNPGIVKVWTGDDYTALKTLIELYEATNK